MVAEDPLLTAGPGAPLHILDRLVLCSCFLACTCTCREQPNAS